MAAEGIDPTPKESQLTRWLLALWAVVSGVTCAVGFHRWGPWIPREVHHTSKPEVKKPWAHMCTAKQRYCGHCGKNSLPMYPKKCAVLRVL